MTKKQNISEDDDYPPEIQEARTNAALRACLNLPPKDDAERLLRKQISDDLERNAEKFSNHKPKRPRTK